ncbi:MAG TPA: hypothetical protein VGD55_00220 [Acidothermaceae bacterium]
MMKQRGRALGRSVVVRGSVALGGLCTLAALVAVAPAGAALRAHGTAALVTVTVSDSAMRVSATSASSGPTTFVLVNHGKKLHALVISGPGVKKAQTQKVTAGHSAEITVTLRPGAYELSDPVGLGAYDVQFLDAIPATTVSATGSSAVVTPPAPLPPMCGQYYSP